LTVARSANSVESKSVDFEVIASAIAKAMCLGDMVNLRLIFAPFSPARPNSSENFDMPKYEYLLPDDELAEGKSYKDCLAEVRRLETKAHIQQELQANRPPQLPAHLVMTLADNAVRLGKYSIAAQAYELLRIRDRMQLEFLNQADAAFDAGDIAKAAKGYIVAVGLAYDYAAFPEPLPLAPDFQTRALLLHAEYPRTMADCVGVWETERLVAAALNYLLLDPELAARLDKRALDLRLAFLKEYVLQRDPGWAQFVERYQSASAALRAFADRLKASQGEQSLAEQIKNQSGEDPRTIPALLLGREIENGEWWQYLKELAAQHPAAAFFVARQAIGDTEILLPRHAPGSLLAQALNMPDNAVTVSAGN